MVLTFVFGIVPATMLVFLSIAMGAAGATALFEFGDPPASALKGLLGVVAALLSLFGYVALFYAAGDAVTPRVARWLAGGVIANLIGIGFLLGDPEWLSPGVVFLVLSPLVVGCAHLARFSFRTRLRRASV
jgi:hypothetical protein